MNVTDGCDFIGRFVDLAHHQITCELSDIPNQCILHPCAEKLRKKPMIEHFINQHKALSTNNKIENGKFHIEVFKQINNEEDWKCFQWRPYVFRREVDDEERFYLVQVWSESWVLYAKVFSLTHNSEPVRYLLDLPKNKGADENKAKYILISNTLTYKKSAPVLCLPINYILKNYGYKHTREDIKAIFLQFQLSSKDFYNFL